MEIPIVLSENSINVAGLVDQIDLSVDAGATGRRGAVVFSGPDAPPTTPPGSLTSLYGTIDAFQPGDLYIRTGPPYYSWVYSYQQQPGGAVWAPVIAMNPSIYYERKTVSFTSGVGTAVTIPLTSIVGTATAPAASKFIVNATVQYTTNDTIVYVVSVKGVSIVGPDLSILFNARAITAGASPTAPTASLDLNVSVGIQS